MIPNMPKPKANINGNTATCNLQPATKEQKMEELEATSQSSEPRAQNPVSTVSTVAEIPCA